VPVIHSSAFLREQAGSAKGSYLTVGAAATKKKLSADEDLSTNAMEWALRQADAYFDKVETESDANRSARALVRNPATQATMKTMQVWYHENAEVVQVVEISQAESTPLPSLL
jgi:hypothetical protein